MRNCLRALSADRGVRKECALRVPSALRHLQCEASVLFVLTTKSAEILMV